MPNMINAINSNELQPFQLWKVVAVAYQAHITLFVHTKHIRTHTQDETHLANEETFSKNRIYFY